MTDFPWLPLETPIGESLLIGRLITMGDGYQLIAAKADSRIILLVRAEAQWATTATGGRSQLDALCEQAMFKPYEFGEEKYFYGTFTKENMPVRVESLVMNIGSPAPVDRIDLASSIAAMTELYPEAVWETSLYLPSMKTCLAINFDRSRASVKYRQPLAVRLVAGAVQNTNITPVAIHNLNPEISIGEITEFLEILLAPKKRPQRELRFTKQTSQKDFKLPGRPELEDFFREHIIDYFSKYTEYQAMGIKPPNGILLYGPPGTGKTHTVRTLANFLQWKVFDIDIGSIGSPYIHQTSKMLKDLFERAAVEAPSIVLMEEIDALAGARTGSMNDHKVEEISQLLRLIETSADQGILVIATTNRFQSMDKAIVRTGRFDHVIEVGLPKKAEIESALRGMFNERPLSKVVNLAAFADSFLGHPMSDIAWTINEAARIAVKSEKKEIDENCIADAIAALKRNAKVRNNGAR